MNNNNVIKDGELIRVKTQWIITSKFKKFIYVVGWLYFSYFSIAFVLGFISGLMEGV